MSASVVKRALIVLLALGVSVPVIADEGPLAARAREQIVTFLQLTPDQIDGWDALLAEREEAVAPIHEALADVEGQLQELFAMEDPDPTEVGELVLERRDLGEALADAHRTYVEGFVALLDEDQAKRFGFIHRAEQAAPLFPAFRLFGFLPPR